MYVSCVRAHFLADMCPVYGVGCGYGAPGRRGCALPFHGSGNSVAAAVEEQDGVMEVVWGLVLILEWPR